MRKFLSWEVWREGNSGTEWQQGVKLKEGTFPHSKAASLCSCNLPCQQIHTYHDCSLGRLYTKQGGQTKVFQPLYLRIIIYMSPYSNILECFTYSVNCNRYKNQKQYIRRKCVCQTYFMSTSKNTWSSISNKDRKSTAPVISSELPPFHFRAPVQRLYPSTGHSCREDHSVDHTVETKPFLASSLMQLRRARWAAITVIELPCFVIRL